MSDWEDEYDEDGAAIHKPAAKSAPVEWKVPHDDRQPGNICCGVRSGTRFGEGRAERSGRFKSRSGGGQGRALSPGADRGGRRPFDDRKSDFSPPVTITVGNASVGRVIGRGGAKIRELEEITGARIKINKGDYEGEVVIFGSSAAQQKAKEMIEDLVADGSSRFSNGPGRVRDYGGGDGEINGSVWSASELQAANAAPARVSIDWNSIRENKEKYEELKWKDLPPLKKKFYTEAESVSMLTAEEVSEWRPAKPQTSQFS